MRKIKPLKYCRRCDLWTRTCFCMKCFRQVSYKRTEYHRSNMSRKMTGKPKPHLRGLKRPEVALKIAAAWTPEMREAARKRGQENAKNPEWRRKVSMLKEANPMWKGGIANSKYAPGFDKTLKLKIRTRDQFTCLLCGVREDETGCRHSIHHIDYDKSNHSEDNLATTCKACNTRVNINESVWFGYFTAIIHSRKLVQNVSDLVGRKIISQRVGSIIVDHLPAEVT